MGKCSRKCVWHSAPPSPIHHDARPHVLCVPWPGLRCPRLLRHRQGALREQARVVPGIRRPQAQPAAGVGARADAAQRPRRVPERGDQPLRRHPREALWHQRGGLAAPGRGHPQRRGADEQVRGRARGREAEVPRPGKLAATVERCSEENLSARRATARVVGRATHAGVSSTYPECPSCRTRTPRRRPARRSPPTPCRAG